MPDNKIELRTLYENRLKKIVNLDLNHVAWKGSQGGHWFEDLMKVGDLAFPLGKEVPGLDQVVQKILKQNTDPKVAVEVITLMKHFHRKWVEEVSKGNTTIDQCAKVLDTLFGAGDLKKAIDDVNKAGGDDIWGGYKSTWNKAIRKTQNWESLYKSLVDD